MKKKAITITLVMLTILSSFAQINKTKLSPNIKEGEIRSKMNIVKINKLNSLKNLNDIQKLSIKSSQLSSEQESARYSRSWSINPNKLSDGSLKLLNSRGYISTAPPNLFLTTDDDSGSTNVSSGSSNEIELGIFPLKLSLAVSTGAEYRINIKSRRTPHTNHIYMATTNGGQQGYSIIRLELNSRDEYNGIFQAENSANMEIYLTAIANPDNHYHDWMMLTVKEIRVDQIN